MELPVNQLDTKKLNIGQEVCLGYATERDVVIRKKAKVVALSETTVIVLSGSQEFVFSKTTKSICGEYVLFNSVEEFKEYINEVHKFEKAKEDLMEEIGDLTDGLKSSDIEAITKSVKLIKTLKSKLNFMDSIQDEGFEGEGELDNEVDIKEMFKMFNPFGLVDEMSDFELKYILGELKVPPFTIHAQEPIKDLTDLFSNLPIKDFKVIKFPKK